MSLESEITALRAAIEANTAALSGGKSGASASPNDDPDDDKSTKGRRGGKGGRGGKGAADDAPTVEQVKAAAVKVKDELGTPVAKKLIKKAGKAEQLADIDPENYGAFIKACEDALKEAEEGGEEETL